MDGQEVFLGTVAEIEKFPPLKVLVCAQSGRVVLSLFIDLVIHERPRDQLSETILPVDLLSTEAGRGVSSWQLALSYQLAVSGVGAHLWQVCRPALEGPKQVSTLTRAKERDHTVRSWLLALRANVSAGLWN